ncbi:MAG: crossover junction endodeoxyribonuclease RuvC [Candidatus Sumerlaeia bacterium]|nr:crossover junction endodeoxyribonuclease RuvC [Candidatus Sumerlaeia bacterium]
MTTIKIMGIDPGLAAIGWGIITAQHQKIIELEYGAIRTSNRLPLPERLHKIYQQLKLLGQRTQPSALAIEQLIFSTNQLTAIQVAQSRGVAILAFAELGIPVFEYSPLQIKQSVTGYGRASKEQVRKMLLQLLGLKNAPASTHSADAIATAVCHLFHSRMDYQFRRKR